jgi:hypothetical protein
MASQAASRGAQTKPISSRRAMRTEGGELRFMI